MKELNKDKKTGTEEWADSNVNIQKGCEHDCLYCYAKCNSVRFKMKTPESWKNVVLKPDAIAKGYGKRKGRIMFPSSHDITPSNVDDCVSVLLKMLKARNEVVIVSKPRVSVAEKLIGALLPYRDQIIIRFTIGSTSNEVLRFWEPGAPTFEQRLESLKLAYNAGYKTSVSCEPMLDQHIDRVIEAVRPYVNESIWLGKINNLRRTVALNCTDKTDITAQVDQLLEWQSDESILKLVDRYDNDPLIMWKDSIRVVKEQAHTKDKNNGVKRPRKSMGRESTTARSENGNRAGAD